MLEYRTYSAKTYLALFVLFIAVLTALYFGSLGYYWVWEDLHLVRIFSPGEILSTFHGTWDVDNVETPGLRPATVVFNHLRCRLFGENLPAHKLFIILLFSVYLVSVCYIANRYFGMKLSALILASLLIIFYKYNSVHVLWQISGNRTLQYLLLSATLLLFLRHLDNGRKSSLLCSLTLYVLSLLTREDTIAAIPTLFILPFVYIQYKKTGREFYSRYTSFVTGVIIVTILFLLLRKLCIPQATLARSMFGEKGGITNILPALLWSASPFGKLYIRSLNISLCWFIIFGALFTLSLFLFDSSYRYSVLILAVCCFFACAPAYMVFRPDILFLPSCLFCLILALMLVKYAERSWAALFASTVLYCVLLLLAAITNYAQQQSFHPFSARQLSREYNFLYGEYSHTTVPARRVAYLTEKFNSLGFTKDNFDHKAVDKKAEKVSLLRPMRENAIFSPKFKHWLP